MLFDRSKDPLEMQDRLAEMPISALYFVTRMQQELSQELPPAETMDDSQIEADTRLRLRTMGYVN